MDTKPNEPTSQAPPPALMSHLTIGFNQTTRHLENLSFRSSPAAQTPLARKTLPHPRPTTSTSGTGQRDETTQQSSHSDEDVTASLRHVAAIFVPRSAHPSILHSHLPVLVHTASMAHPNLPQTRLVALPKGCESRLQEALALPRVNFLGVLDETPEASQLIEFVREHVPIIDVPWLPDVKQGNFLPLQVEVTQCPVSTMNKAQKRKLQAETHFGSAEKRRGKEKGSKGNKIS